MPAMIKFGQIATELKKLESNRDSSGLKKRWFYGTVKKIEGYLFGLTA